jgi:hypothetical protein
MKNPELTEYGRRAREALDHFDVAQSKTLERAIAAGQVFSKVKEYLKDNPTVLQTFEQWFRSHCRGYSIKTAYRHIIVYKQTSNSQKVYQSIEEVKKDWRLTHPKKKRYVPPTTKEASAQLLRQQVAPELPAFERVRMGPWLADDRTVYLLKCQAVVESCEKYPEVAELLNTLLEKLEKGDV